MEILELGPFEAYDSRLFEELGAAEVVAIEGSNINFLKCLVLKQALGLKTCFLDAASSTTSKTMTGVSTSSGPVASSITAKIR